MGEAIDDEEYCSLIVCDEQFDLPEIKSVIREKATLEVCGLHQHYRIKLSKLVPEIDEMFRYKYRPVAENSRIDLHSESRIGGFYEGDSLEVCLFSLLLCDDSLVEIVAKELCDSHTNDDYNEDNVFMLRIQSMNYVRNSTEGKKQTNGIIMLV